MTGLWIALGVIGGVVLLIGLYVILSYNKLVGLNNNVEEAFSTMDVYLKKRYDLIPNIVETVKGYAKHEKETLENVIKARNVAFSSATREDRIKNENALSQTLKSLFKLTENYPDLKANTNFLSLQNQLEVIEGEIAQSRKYYNACVRENNNAVSMFPSNIVAKWFKFGKKASFEVDSPEERKNVKVEF